MHLTFPINQVLQILNRHARTLDPLEQEAISSLKSIDQQQADLIWMQLTTNILLEPSLVSLLWPKSCEQHPDLIPLIRQINQRSWNPGLQKELATHIEQWLVEHGNADNTDSLLYDLLKTLQHTDFVTEKSFQNLSRYYAWRDLVITHLVAPDLIPLQLKIFNLLFMQSTQWKNPYTSGYAYQGYERIGIAGAKPTQQRLQEYGLLPWLKPSMHILEIGCNNGFIALEIARSVEHVDAIEFNPYLIEIGRAAAAALEQHNVTFEVADFPIWKTNKQYDVVLSFANHCTIDGNLAMNFEDYVAKLWRLTCENGYVLFESHNVFGPGRGGPGDDGDLDQKFDIAEKYFEYIDSKMTSCFIPAYDIDKLFVVLRKRNTILPQAQRKMDLSSARKRYSFLGTPFSAQEEINK